MAMKMNYMILTFTYLREDIGVHGAPTEHRTLSNSQLKALSLLGSQSKTYTAIGLQLEASAPLGLQLTAPTPLGSQLEVPMTLAYWLFAFALKKNGA